MYSKLFELFKHHIARIFGNEDASPDAETMPEERQRRFWVSFFYKSRMKNGEFNASF